MQDDASVGDIAALYLGNILYALEVTALQYDEQEQAEHAEFYRGIARKLAEARGRELRPPGPGAPG